MFEGQGHRSKITVTEENKSSSTAGMTDRGVATAKKQIMQCRKADLHLKL